MEQKNIRNFCIIAHIDHGKSTLADRFLELTGTVEKRKMQEQLLDQMDLEREKGITIKLAPATMNWKGKVLNLIDTPGHVDFTYEVSRSLAAVEGAILLVDATQGVQAQTIANLNLALEQGLTIIPVLNKIDLPASDVESSSNDLEKLLGCAPENIYKISAKTGEGVSALLDAVIEKIPPPGGWPSTTTRALVFDSLFDEYRGVVAYVRVVDGELKAGDILKMVATGIESQVLEVGNFKPKQVATQKLETGQIGYIVTGQKDIRGIRVGDTMTMKNFSVAALPGYREVRPMVFAGIFPEEGVSFEKAREAMMKLQLNDSSLQFEAEKSPSLGFGFRAGFLGLLHLEILRERLEREFGIRSIVTHPSVAYKVLKTNGEVIIAKSPLDLPEQMQVEVIEEPWAEISIISPSEFMGKVMQLAAESKGIYKTTEYLSEKRATIKFEIPLSAIITDFHDKLKSVTAGYASMNYSVIGYREADIVRMDILLAEEPVEAFSTLVYSDEAPREGRRMVEKLRDSLPKQMFVVKIQAVVGGKIVASEKLSAMRKDVTAKLYGGDVTRKRKLLDKQKKGKQKMAAIGRGKVDIPANVYISFLKR